MNNTILPLGRGAQEDNQASYYEPRNRKPDPLPRMDWHTLLTWGGLVSIGWILVLIVFTLYRVGSCWDREVSAACTFAVGVQNVWMLGPPAVGASLLLWHWGLTSLVRYRRQSVLYNEADIPESVHHVATGGARVEARTRAVLQTRIEIARLQPYGGGIDALHIQQAPHSNAITDVTPHVWTPQEVFDLLNLHVNSHPHTFLYGASGTGKTTFGKAMLRQRGGEIVVLTPKAEDVDIWGDIPVVIPMDGASTDAEYYQPLAVEASRVLAEFRRRSTTQKPVGGFESLTLVVDEWFTTVKYVPELGTLLKEISSIGRSRNIRLVTMSQTDRVTMNAMAGAADLMENFTRVYFGRMAAELHPLAAKYATESKKAAVIYVDAEPDVIDTRTIPNLASR